MSICLLPNQLSSGEVILNNGDFLGRAFLLQHFRLATSDVAWQASGDHRSVYRDKQDIRHMVLGPYIIFLPADPARYIYSRSEIISPPTVIPWAVHCLGDFQ